MAGIVRLGDGSSHGGTMITATGTFHVNGKQACVSGDVHACPIPGHGQSPVTSSISLNNNGKPVIHVDCVAGCGAVMITGSGNVSTEG